MGSCIVMSIPSREQFLNDVFDHVGKKFPLVKLSRARQAFSMRVNGHVASLENVYRLTQLHPEQKNHHVERWVVELLRAAEGLPDENGSFGEMRDRIMPMIVPMPDDDRTRAVFQPLIDGLAVAYAVDHDRTISYLTPQRLTDWGVGIDELHKTAIKNLLRRSQTLSAQAAQDEAGEIYLVLLQTMDGYDASRILLPSLHDKLRSHLGSPFAAAIPNRDILLCFRNNQQTIDRLHPQVQSDFRQMPHQVTDQILLVTPDGLAPR